MTKMSFLLFKYVKYMNIYDYEKYRKYLQDWLFHQPKHGHGVVKSWAEAMGVHSTLLSQILNNKKDLSLEQADRLTEILNLTEQEAEYFLLLVLFERAGSQNLKRKFKKRIQDAQEKSKNISMRLNVKNVLSEEAKAKFYSSWIYSGIRNLSALPSMSSADEIANKLGLPRELIQSIIEFLLEQGLCVQTEKGLSYGPSRTHVASDSPWVAQHHRNWRDRSVQKMLLRRNEDLYFTFPMSISGKDADKVRKLIPTWIETIHGIVGPSPSESVRCLNIDFFEY
jgi:uncharacterized protein (TIGR02147 family)